MKTLKNDTDNTCTMVVSSIKRTHFYTRERGLSECGQTEWNRGYVGSNKRKNSWDELKNMINFSCMATVVDENGEVDMEIRQNRIEQNSLF